MNLPTAGFGLPVLGLTPLEVEELLLLEDEARRSMEEVTRAGFLTYLSDMWPVIESGNPFIPGYHIDAMADVLVEVTRGNIQDLLITIPPRHSKSIAVGVAWPTWEWGPVNRPDLRWIFSSYAQQLSIRDSNKRRRVIKSPWYQANWGDRFRLGGESYTPDGSTRYENEHGGYHLATSVKGSNTGEGGDRVVADDPHNVKETHYDTIREETVRWWTEVMSTRRNNPNQSARVVIMQRVHHSDVAQACVDAGYVHLNLPLEYNRKRHCDIRVGAFRYSDWRTEEGELLDPERFGPAVVARLKEELGSYAYSGQFQQNPTPVEGGIIKKVWVRYWLPEGHAAWDSLDALDRSITVPLPKRMDPGTKTISWDMAFKEALESDLVCGQVWGKVKADHFLLEYDWRRLSFTNTLKAVKSLSSRHPDCVKVLVEEAANGIAVLDSLRSTVTGLIGVQPLASKNARVHAVQPLFEAGQVYLPHPRIQPPIPAGCLDPVTELVAFPNATHDDWVDSLTQALIRMTVHASRFGSRSFGQIDI